ncbi:MAG: preprotein translocase subunit SecA [Candidatus Sungbacteria bacterium]|nr:preprotein translocase subunit SecA [Candidatus Sungbacteria bacterium]
MAFLSIILGDSNRRFLKAFDPLVAEVNSFGPEFEKLSDEGLKDKTSEFRKRLLERETLDDLLPEAFAAVREASGRAIGQRHFDVQILGGIVLHQGRIAEMKTGEGKTLVATLPLYLNALSGQGCHLVTPNDYLSRVGGGWMGPVYDALGVSVGVITHDFSGIYDPAYRASPSHGDERLDHWRPVSRREAYACDITYGTNNEFGFDYLRDNMAYRLADMVQRLPDEGGHSYAIVDEVDSILIDEARTPLIISAPDEESAEYYRTFARVVPELKENADYNIDEKMKAVTITEEGIEKVEKLLGVENIYAEKGFRYVRYLEQALRAQGLFVRDRDYVVRNGEVVIVDEFTGRLMPGRRWSEGLHQAIEAKEGVQVQRESRTLATITFQNLFRMYKKLAGMTGTAATSAEEFHKVYKLDVVSIPTHRPLVRSDLSDLIFRTEPGKFTAAAREIKKRHQAGQPVLVGTVSIEKNERMSAYLKREGVPHQMLNAKNHEQEALVIAQAGRLGAVTIATNIAGRGVDIILGGSPPDAAEAAKVCELGGLFVLGTERHEARRIDNQLRGRSGRQGDPGQTQFFLSLEDDLMRVFGGERIKSMMESFGIPEDQSIENRLVTKSIESAQSKIEGFHFDARKHVLEFDDVMNKQRDYIYRLRREVLYAAESSPDDLFKKLDEMIEGEVSALVAFHAAASASREWNTEEIAESVKAIAEVKDDFHAELLRLVGEKAGAEAKREEIKRFAASELKNALDNRKKAAGEGAVLNAAKAVMLQAVDVLWMDHLDTMEHLRDSVRLRAYGQRDPLVEYKNEGVKLFRNLQSAIRSQIVSAIFKVGADARERLAAPEPVPANIVFRSAKETENQPQFSGTASANPAAKKPSIGRNDPCPCGSGKKYKKCHGK